MNFPAEAILVTGATNQIGRMLLPMLEESCCSVVAISRKQHRSEHAHIVWLQQNIKSPNLPTIECTSLIHLAHIALLPNLLSQSNASFPFLTRVIAFSSTSAISKRNSPNPKERKMADDLYSAEEQVASLCKSKGIEWTIFRPTLVYGCEMDQNVNAIEQFISRFGFFPIIGSGTGLRQPVHAHDLALSCLNVLHNEKSYGKIYSLSGGETLTYREMVERIFQKLNKPPRIYRIPLSLFQLLLGIASFIPKLNHLTPEMANRMNSDLCYDHEEATLDFGYTPAFFNP